MELTGLKDDFEHVSKQCNLMEAANSRLSVELKQAQTLLIDIADQERAKYEDKIISLQMNLKIKSEKYRAAKSDFKQLEKAFKR